MIRNKSGLTLALSSCMKKTTKKLVINREKLRELVDTNLERVNGGWINTAGSDWCSSSAARKCGGGTTNPTQSQYCHNP